MFHPSETKQNVQLIKSPLKQNMKRELLYDRRLFIPIVTATSEMSLLFFFLFVCFFNIYFSQEPCRTLPLNGTQTHIIAPDQHQCGPWTPQQNKIQCLAMRPKGPALRKKQTKKMDLSSLLCNCGGKESMIKVFINLKKKKPFCTEIYFYENTFVL